MLIQLWPLAALPHALPRLVERAWKFCAVELISPRVEVSTRRSNGDAGITSVGDEIVDRMPKTHPRRVDTPRALEPEDRQPVPDSQPGDVRRARQDTSTHRSCRGPSHDVATAVVRPAGPYGTARPASACLVDENLMAPGLAAESSGHLEKPGSQRAADGSEREMDLAAHGPAADVHELQ